MKKIIRVSVLAIFLGFIFSCEDILEKDISDRTITIIYPNEGDVIEGNTVQFLWNTLDGASQYNIQVYDGNTLITDTMVTNPSYTQIMNAGKYQWRIRGENFAYATNFNFPVAFEVVESAELTNQTLILSTPAGNLFTNQTTIIFTWQSLPSATSYTFELIKVTATGNLTVHFQEGLQATSLQLDNTVLDEDAHYIWKIKGVNDMSETAYSSRNLFIDTVEPTSPILLTPEFEEEFDKDENINFSWNLGADTGNINSPVSSYYEISTDSSFNNVIVNGTIENTNFNLSFATDGSYYWRVRGEDQAGNIGTFNQSGKFIINE